MTLADGFWRSKSLEQMAPEEWESLCDGCGRCCLNKIEDEDTGEILFTRLSCEWLDIPSCRCKSYENRSERVAGCLRLHPGFAHYHWLPASCAYRLIHEGKDLPAWHPLVTGRPESVHEAGVSVRHIAIPETGCEDIEDYVDESLS